MDLLSELNKHRITFQLRCPSMLDAEQAAGMPKTARGTPIPHHLLTLHFPQGEPLHHWVREAGEKTPTDMLAHCLRDEPRAADLMSMWYAHHGNVPVVLENTDPDCVAELVHVSMRKIGGEPADRLAYRALADLDYENRVAFWTVVRRVVADTFSEAESKLGGKFGRLPTRRKLATNLKNGIQEFFEDMDKSHKVVNGSRVARDENETFKLMTLHYACQMTSMMDWMWVWLSYLVRDANEQEREEAKMPRKS